MFFNSCICLCTMFSWKKKERKEKQLEVMLFWSLFGWREMERKETEGKESQNSFQFFSPKLDGLERTYQHLDMCPSRLHILIYNMIRILIIFYDILIFPEICKANSHMLVLYPSWLYHMRRNWLTPIMLKAPKS